MIVPANQTLIGMFSAADPVVKGVMIILIVASFTGWTVFLAKLAAIAAARRQLRADLRILDEAISLDRASSVVFPANVLMVELARREVARCDDLNAPGVIQNIKDRYAIRIHSVTSHAIQTMLVGVNLLATIGSTAPFVGLSGTVWGIMNSFSGIAKSHTTNLATVAPGIAEALLATALGLMAAIPAVLFYNVITRKIAAFRQAMQESAALATCMLSLDLERRAAGVQAVPLQVRHSL